MKYLEAIEVLNQKQQVIENGNSLSDYHCKLLSEYFEHYPIFVTHFPPRLQGFNVATKDDKVMYFKLSCQYHFQFIYF